MELTQLKYFLEVAKRQHVTQSAEALHIAQPALTQSIRRLEEELEIPLFVSKERNIILSPYGRYFYEKLQPLIEKINELPDQIKSMAKLENSTVHLNVLAASSLIIDAIIEYKKINEDLHFQLKQNEMSDLYDICVTTAIFYKDSGTPHDEMFICTEKIYLAVPNIEKFRGRNSISLQEVKDENFISLSGSRQLRSICDKYCEDAKIKLNTVFESDSPAAVKNMIAANMGIGFWPSFSWGTLDNGKVRLLEIDGQFFSRDILISYKKNKRDNTDTHAFYDYLTKYFTAAANIPISTYSL